jgi:hypothetical protein
MSCPITIAMIACHHVKPSAISELPVMYEEIFELTRTPKHKTRKRQYTCDSNRILNLRTVVMERPEPPRPTTSLNRLDVVVDPSVRHGAALVADLEFSKKRLHWNGYMKEEEKQNSWFRKEEEEEEL